jgi:16S rRNA (cytosine1402-N4)-methyltransferase
MGVHTTYDQIEMAVASCGFQKVDGILLDLGISSMQIDDPNRGFSYANDTYLDMRMNQQSGSTAADILNTYSEAELRRILWEYGEEKFAPKIAAAIVARRSLEPWESTADLAATIDRQIPFKAKRTGGHPAKRTFQALRIEVNQELECLAAALPAAIETLNVGGRIVIESYQSLEDRLVKREFAKGLVSSAPVGLPQPLPEHAPYLRALTRGAERADATELAQNSRAASVRLRAAELIRTPNDGAKQVDRQG